MCSSMWDNHTEELFQETTVEQAMRSPSKSGGSMSKAMQAWAAEALLHSSTNLLPAFSKYKDMPKAKSKSIKFRRYITHVRIPETEMVGGFIAEAVTTLGDRREKRSIRPCDLSGLGDSSLQGVEEF